MTASNVAGLCAATLLLAGCGSPNAPSTVEAGVIVYADPAFKGQSMIVTADIAGLDDIALGCIEVGVLGTLLKNNWDDCISSIRIASSWTATLYDDPGFRGRSLAITSDLSDLDNQPGPCGDDWNDCASSIRISRP